MSLMCVVRLKKKNQAPNWTEKNKSSGSNVIPLAFKRVCYRSVYIERSQGWETPNVAFSHSGWDIGRRHPFKHLFCVSILIRFSIRVWVFFFHNNSNLKAAKLFSFNTFAHLQDAWFSGWIRRDRKQAVCAQGSQEEGQAETAERVWGFPLEGWNILKLDRGGDCMIL